MNGKLIVLSGIDGSGKTTLANSVREYLFSRGEDKCAVLDAMKGGRYIGCLCELSVQYDRSLRNLFSPELLNVAWAADLIENYEMNIQAYLNEGYTVVLHRSDLCCRVYSQLFSQHTSLVNRMLDGFNLQADIHIYLDLDPAAAYERIRRRNQGKAMTEKECMQRLICARNAYQEWLNTERYKDVIQIQADDNLETVAKSIFRELDRCFMVSAEK